MRLRIATGSVTITSVERTQVKGWVYNLSIAGAHTYTVGTSGVLVHNMCEIVGGAGAADNVADAAGAGKGAAGAAGKVDEAADAIDPGTPGRKTKGQTTQFDKTGGLDQANKDFDAMGLKDVRDLGEGKRMGTNANGDTVVIYPKSSGGTPSIDVQSGNKHTKTRYSD